MVKVRKITNITYKKSVGPIMLKEKILEFAGKGGIKREALKSLRKDWKKWPEKYA